MATSHDEQPPSCCSSAQASSMKFIVIVSITVSLLIASRVNLKWVRHFELRPVTVFLREVFYLSALLFGSVH